MRLSEKKDDKMYTLVFKSKDGKMIVFDVYLTKRGKQRIIGNIFCKKKEGEYQSYSFLGISSVPELIIPNDKIQQLYDRAEQICNSQWMNQ